MKLTKEEILEKYKAKPEFLDKFSSLYSLKFILGRCIIDSQYELNKSLNDFIILTKAGQKKTPDCKCLFPLLHTSGNVRP